MDTCECTLTGRRLATSLLALATQVNVVSPNGVTVDLSVEPLDIHTHVEQGGPQKSNALDSHTQIADLGSSLDTSAQAPHAHGPDHMMAR